MKNSKSTDKVVLINHRGASLGATTTVERPKVAYVMIDLETLDTTRSSVILSIGAVRFDATNILDEMYSEVNIDDQLKLGRKVSGRTICWWHDQNDLAKKVFETNEGAPRLASALAKLGGFVIPGDTVWGNGASFDIGILEDAYDCLEINTPWQFHEVRCYRTFKELFPDVRKEAQPAVEHNALCDARAQALHMQLLLARAGLALPLAA